jgi:excisionase family DNA binding protein
MTVADVAKYLRVHRITIYRLASRGKLPSFKIGRVRRFHRSDVTEFLKEQSRIEIKSS